MRGTAWLLATSILALTAPWTGAVAQGNQRSAQGDCTREVARRGYTVLSTGNFEQSREGWQLDVTARDHRGRVTSGSCFVETRTGDVSLYGFGWGGAGTIDRFEFSCASKEKKYRECQLPIDGRARLVKRKSDAPCIEGQSWGQRGDRVWVTQGCKAKFEVVRGGPGGDGQTLDCRSQNNRYRECAVRAGYEARLVRDYSGRCRKDSTWGNRPGVLWVTNGCQGSFQLVRVGGGSGAVTAERACLDEARRQGYRVTRQDAARPISGGYGMNLAVKRGNGPEQSAYCRYRLSSGRAQLEIRAQ